MMLRMIVGLLLLALAVLALAAHLPAYERWLYSGLVLGSLALMLLLLAGMVEALLTRRLPAGDMSVRQDAAPPPSAINHYHLHLHGDVTPATLARFPGELPAALIACSDSDSNARVWQVEGEPDGWIDEW